MSGRPPEGRAQETAEQRQALDAFFEARYQELRRIAGNLKRGDSSITLNPTALVNEAWLRLAASADLRTLSPMHFKALAARAMRRVLIDAARRRHAHKRSGDALVVTVIDDDALERHAVVEDDLLGLDEALRDLERVSPRQATLVEGRYFGGLTVQELAELLNVSDTTVEREWRAARAWLKSQLRDAPGRDEQGHP